VDEHEIGVVERQFIQVSDGRLVGVLVLLDLGDQKDLTPVDSGRAPRAAEAAATGGRGVWAPQMRELLAAKKLIDTGLGFRFAAGAMLAQCPYPEDRAVVADVAKQVLGYVIEPLATGAQVR
jgi:hypothetical protein